MKKQYSSPNVIEFGSVGDLTFGTGGHLPDFVSGHVVNNTCGTQTFTGTTTGGATSTFTRSACINY